MRRALWLWTGVNLFLFLVDRISRTLAFHQPAGTIIPNLLESQPTTNTGVALGIALPGPLTYSLIATLIVVVAIIVRSAYQRQEAFRFGAGLLVGFGALSNVLDRLAYGAVRDFLKFNFWPTTANLGDWMITVGTLLLILASVPRRHTRPPAP